MAWNFPASPSPIIQPTPLLPCHLLKWLQILQLQFFDYEQKYMPGRATEFTPARCSQQIIKKIQKTCIKVMQLLNFNNLARIDGFVTARWHSYYYRS